MLGLPRWAWDTLITRRCRLRGCLKSLHGFLQRYRHAMVIVDFRELRTIVTSSEAALHQLKTLMSGLFKQPLRPERPHWPWFSTAPESAWPNLALDARPKDDLRQLLHVLAG